MVDQLNGQWHPDPTGRHQLRWWDGQEWTDFVADGGFTAIDPVAGSPAPGQGYAAAAPVQYQPYATAPVVGNERVPAGIPLTNPWARLGSSLIDLVLIIVTLVIGWLIWTLIVWSKGQTPGKQICGQRVVMKRTGRAATWGEMALRDFVIR
ncbi:MAG TPA: RDD family protein, partial [Actinomycetota bacterium]|nr:RDD family protein [Actinomycetota bacterium]